MLVDYEGLNPLTNDIIAAAIAVHRTFGPGLLESVYRSALASELRTRGRALEIERDIAVEYGNERLDVAFRADLIVDSKVLVETKAIRAISPVHVAQVATYLKLTGCRVGLLINFNVVLLKHGIRRVLHPDLRSSEPDHD